MQGVDRREHGDAHVLRNYRVHGAGDTDQDRAREGRGLVVAGGADVRHVDGGPALYSREQVIRSIFIVVFTDCGLCLGRRP